MIRLKRWQWIVLVLPVIMVVGFLLTAAGMQIHTWGVSWIWAIVVLLFWGWRWLLVRWTQPATRQLERVIAEVTDELEAENLAGIDNASARSLPAEQSLEKDLQTILTKAQADPPVWEDWAMFWQRCQAVIVTVAQAYHPEVKYPLLNIYVPQAYGLLRGTVDDMDRTMQKLEPVLNQVTVGQAYQAYEIYRQLEPSVRKLWRVWSWAQWFLNPAAAAARTMSQRSNSQAQQQLLVNLSQLLKETALRNLSQQAIALYSGSALPTEIDPSSEAAKPVPSPTLPEAKTATLKSLFASAEPVEKMDRTPINILLVGRTGAGKSSLINTLFEAQKTQPDLLPNTDTISTYHWETPTHERLNLMDSPGYEQVARTEFRQQVLDYASTADLLLLVTPALDPALQMDADFLKDLRIEVPDLPMVVALTQVDKLRPVREWRPPYDWEAGERPKERAMREAIAYRTQLGSSQSANPSVIPLVTQDRSRNRNAWNADALSLALVDVLDDSKQIRLARFLRSRAARTVTAAKIIDRYTLQMTTTQGLAALVKSPVLRYISMLMTGSELLATALMEKIPVEQAPVVVGKLQLAYDLFSLLSSESDRDLSFDLLAIWPLLLDDKNPPDKSAWALGYSLVEYWLQTLTAEQLKTRYQSYLQQDL